MLEQSEACRGLTNLWYSPLQWKENLTLTESQVQALALSRQASQEFDVKRREAIYNDVLTKQQMVSTPSVSCGPHEGLLVEDERSTFEENTHVLSGR